jgi:hypothetical protein
MKTMTHTPQQQKAWHAGKKINHLSSRDSYYRALKKGRFGGANTPQSAKKGIYYEPLKARRKSTLASLSG